MKVPGPIKALFDHFPLATYPPIANTTVNNEKELQSHKFYYDGTTSGSFQLGIYNVIDVNGTLVPSDPISCFHSLVLAANNKLKLPRAKNGANSGNSLTIVSGYSAPDNQLPVLIEDSGDSRAINSSSAMNALIAKKLSPQELVVDQLFSSLYDCWILCLLCDEEAQESFGKIFNLDDSIAGKLDIVDLYHQMPRWQAFSARHPNLFDSNYDIKQYITGRNDRALASYYEAKLGEVTNELPLLVAYNESSTLQLKLMAYFITINETLSATRLGGIIEQHREYLDSCYKRLETS